MRSILCTFMGTLALALAGCGDDTEPGGSCPEDAAAGATLSCACPDGGADGEQTCQSNGELSECRCGSGASAGSGGVRSGSAGRAGSGGRGGSGGSGAGSGGTQEPAPDAGMMVPPTEPAPDAGPMMMGEPMPLPEDGNQLALCDNGRDCNMDLDCYNSGPGRGFCSQVCETDEDCMALTGAVYACSMSVGVCSIPCMGPEDTQSCPASMVCVNINGGGGGQGEPVFRCKYAPAEPPQPERQPAFGPCMAEMECQEGLQCVADFMGNTGFCSVPCEQSDPCAALMPSSGTIEPSCEPDSPTTGTCALDCSGAPEGCPDGMVCLETNFYSRCGYAE